MPSKLTAEVRATKKGPHGRPAAEILVGPRTSAEDLGQAILQVTRDKDLLRKLGLKACTACKSGMDIIIRERFEHVFPVEIGGFGR